ncbi:hypothetical protein ABAC460_00485 [Asticcacaulis sp. AC460]|uniref:SIMPL domain-containing protein n=1 Tax=Asticcacaulis sp. AC460 TaxID=1282360 RepID=UPI0003C3C284|nr:SIMPL domain-containing protein [Asticcacaulis sp. AC460]ESQ93578.1 hypothetical protein ABAC460_00485 [Asticcacaulis sp. AC460]
MKPLFSLAAVLAVAATSAAAQTAPPASYGKAPWWMKDQVIAQTGFVITEVPANRASFSATFLTSDKTVEAAQAQAVERTRGLQQSLAGLGKDKVLVTTEFSMRALYEQYRDKEGNLIDNERGDKIRGYEVVVTIGVEVRDVDLLSAAYGRVMAASPTSAEDIEFRLTPDAKLIAWLDTESVKDARVRAQGAAAANSIVLGRILTIDPTGRACEADILAPAPQIDIDGDGEEVVVTGIRRLRRADTDVDSITAEDIGSFPDKSVGEALQRVSGVTINRFAAEQIEANALKNPFLQTPPLVRKTATACVVFGLN